MGALAAQNGWQAIRPVCASETGAESVHGYPRVTAFVCQCAQQPGWRCSQGIGRKRPFHKLFYQERRKRDRSPPLIVLHSRQDLQGKMNLSPQQSVGPDSPIRKRIGPNRLDGGPPLLVTRISTRAKRCSPATTNRGWPGCHRRRPPARTPTAANRANAVSRYLRVRAGVPAQRAVCAPSRANSAVTARAYLPAAPDES
jgi:hypothetical protein